MHPVITRDSKGAYTKLMLRDSQARSNACWKCGGLAPFQKDCKFTLNSQGGDRDDLALSSQNYYWPNESYLDCLYADNRSYF